MKPSRLLKGIYQHFDANGNVIADERWQAVPRADGSTQLDNETTRVAPFDEPRSDSMGLTLDAHWQLVKFSVHGLFGQRECLVRPDPESPKQAIICWRYKDEINEQRLPWDETTWLSWNTPLLVMPLVWRLNLQPGESRDLTVYALDAVTFRPMRTTRRYQRLEDTTHLTRFGAKLLAHYMQRDETGAPCAEFWCDEEGFVFEHQDFVAQVRYVLTAANLKLLP